MLNYAILKNPLNWLTIILMVMIGLFFIDTVVTWHAGNKAK